MSIEEELQLTKHKLSEKEQHVADLEKKMRLNEFKQKKLTSEMNLTLDAEKMKVKNATDQMERLNTQIQDLEIKLTESEQKSLKLMEELSKKRKNSDSSDEEQKSLNEKLMPRKSMIQKLGDITEIPSYTELIQMIQKYDGNQQQMAAEMQRFQENTSEAFSSRDNQIYALQEEIRQMQDSLLESEKKVSDAAKLIAQKEEKNIEQTQLILNLRQQIDIVKQEKEEQQNEFLGKLNEMNEQKGSIDSAVQDAENKYNKSMMYQEEYYKKREQELIDQLQQNEDKQQQYDQQIEQVESKWQIELKQMDENHKQVLQNKQLQIQQLQKQLIDDSNRFKDEQYKQINELKQDYQNRIKSMEQTIQELNTTIEQDNKKIKKFELEKKRKDQDISDLQENCKLCEEQLQTIKDKSQQMIDQYENQIREIQQNNREQQEQKSVYDQRMSVSSMEPNKSFEIDMLKAQLENLKQKGDIELQSEIAKLNERERALKKELLDLQNDVGTERLNYTLNLRKLELQLEQLQQEVEHAQAEQVYAEQIAAKISVSHANLAMEYENTKLSQRALETQKFMKYLLSILCSIFPILAVDLTTLYVDQQFLLNHTQLFKSQLQVDSDQGKPINPIEDQENEEGRMKQILFEQEERMQKLLSNRKLESQGKKKNENGEEISEDEMDDQSKLSWKKRTNSKLPKKQLQEQYIDGNEADSVQSVSSIAIQHKIVLTVFMIALISVFALMREYYGKGLNKWFRKTIWLIAVDNLQFLIVIFIGIALYYNNYFDNFYLTNQTQRRYVRRDILLIEIQDYDEMYRINVYGYLLSIGIFNIILLLINILNAYVLNREGEIYKQLEEQWDQRQELAKLHKDLTEQLVEKTERYEQIIQLGGGENIEIKDLIKQMNTTIDELHPKLKYFILKQQFLQRIQPYFGPTHLRDDIDYWQYLSRSNANNLYIISQWNIKIVFLLFITLIILTIETYLFSILLTSIQFSFLIFYFIIDLNYRIDQIYASSIIHANIEILEEEEMQQFPQMLDSVFEQNIPDKPVDPQIAHFPFKNEEYFVLSLNYIQKCSTLFLQISIIYIFDWSQMNKYLKSFALVLAILSWLSVIYISQRILIQYAIAMGMFNKQFEIIEQIVKNQRTQLVKSCFSFFELIKFLRRSYQLDDIPKENLIMFRPIMVDILEVCQQFESKKPQELFDEREQVLQQLGMQELNLIPTKKLVTVLDRLGSPYSEQDLVFIDNFCKDQDPDYFSPNRLILYLHLRHQEIKLRSNEIIEQFFNITLPQIYGQIQPFNGHDEQSYKDQQLIGEVDIQELEHFMLESVKSGLLSSTSIKPILQCIKRLKSKSVNRVSEFLANQIAQIPV